MAINVNTLPSNDSNSISIRWLTFRPAKDKINAKKLKIEKDGYIPELGKAKDTYIVENNDIWLRCIKVANKLKKIPRATIKSEEKISNCEKRMVEKYKNKTSKASINR